MTAPAPPPPDAAGPREGADDLPSVVDVVRAGHDGDLATVDAGRGDGAPEVRAAAAGAAVRQASTGAREAGDAVGAVLDALDDEDVQVRRRAAVEAARLATAVDLDGPQVAALRDALLARLESGEDDRVAEVAAFALGELPYPSDDDGPAAAAVDALVEVATTHAEHLCREAAVAALGSIGDPRGLPAVLAGCRDRANVRRRAVLALAAFDDPIATTELERLLGDRDLQVRQAAEELLAIESGEPT